MSIYILLDATDDNYKRLVSHIRERAHPNFTPVLNRPGSKALIQIKDEYPVFEKWMIDRSNTIVLGSGDAAWARTEIKKPGWKTVKDEEGETR